VLQHVADPSGRYGQLRDAPRPGVGEPLSGSKE
jgi:hypothetical protein